jgi:hypothetical protein
MRLTNLSKGPHFLPLSQYDVSKACNPRVFFFSLKKLDIFYKDVFTNANGEHLFHFRQQTTVEQRQGSGGVKGDSFKLVDVVVEF